MSTGAVAAPAPGVRRGSSRPSVLTVYRWGPDGYIEVLAAERGERVKAEPFDAITLQVGVLFGDDEDE